MALSLHISDARLASRILGGQAACTAAFLIAFGQHPEDVLGPAKMAAKGFGWLNEILVSIQRETEGEKFSPRIVKLAGAGAYLAVELENYCSSERESMLQKLQEVGILPPDRRPLD
ncbi:MAG: hypothetical protein NFW04_15585 [Candidatus Accumulibacter sp.]|uniref:hypothetical protein n=1 Tax=Accumulibacter sp. TaxID=2053492 RepID=UPI0025D742FD|nr:hypothetical protein [Accumulibacter sp.]MCM8600053.1 hypothetical protein [Accumulibacter sp.]